MLRLSVKLLAKSSKSNLWTFHSRMMSSVLHDRINVEVKQGVLSGVVHKLPNGNDMNAFKGVPYAKPPLGDLKFKAPLPLDKFEDPILDCSIERDVCFHKDMFSMELVGSEDCLHLNIYTPKFLKGAAKPYPVMVFIHGGAFLFGSGNSDQYSPEYLVQEDVIVVTLNYRLGPLGFLYLPTVGIEGNAGLKDQLMALKWVNENISKFNGDPNNVTIFGESAGAASVHLHYLSPVSRKYFHKAICQSGVSTMEWAMQLYPETKARKLAKIVGAKGDSDEEALEALMNASALELMAGCLATLTEDEKRRGLPMPMRPVVEIESENAIVTKSPFVAVQTPNYVDIPLMMGVNNMEGMIMLLDGIKKLDLYDNDMARLIPRSVNLSPGSMATERVGEEIKKFYFGEENVAKKTLRSLVNLMSDYHFNIFAQMYAELHSKYQHKSPLYYFQFCYDGQLNMYKKMFQFANLPGACHADELFYLFIMKMAEIELPDDSECAQMRRTMCRMWTNFAKHSNPTPKNDDSLTFKWDPIPKSDPKSKDFSLNYLNIDKECKMMINPDKDRIDFWRDVYKRWNEDFLKPKL